MSATENNSGPRRLPIWALTPREEKEARTELKKMAYKECASYIKEMVNCSKTHGLKVFPTCDPQKKKMGECLLFYQTDPKYLDIEKDKIVRRKIAALEEKVKKSKQQSANTE